MSDWSANGGSFVSSLLKKQIRMDVFQTGQSIADMVAAAANEVMVDNYLPGYVYIEAYQAYYNAESNLYYYPVCFGPRLQISNSNVSFQQQGLFYDIAKSCYLRYNQFSGRYEPYIEVKKKTHFSKKRYRWKAIEAYGKKTLESFDQNTIDVIDTVYDLVDRVSFLAGDDEDAQKRYEQKYASSNIKYDEELGDYIACFWISLYNLLFIF